MEHQCVPLPGIRPHFLSRGRYTLTAFHNLLPFIPFANCSFLQCYVWLCWAPLFRNHFFPCGYWPSSLCIEWLIYVIWDKLRRETQLFVSIRLISFRFHVLFCKWMNIENVNSLCTSMKNMYYLKPVSLLSYGLWNARRDFARRLHGPLCCVAGIFQMVRRQTRTHAARMANTPRRKKHILPLWVKTK